MTDLKDTLKDKSKFEFFAIIAQLINFSPINIMEGEEKITLLGENGKLKILHKEQERITDYDKWVDEFGSYLMKDFNENKIIIKTEYDIEND
jgi:hypothetical protein